MSRWLPIATALILILAAGVANGLWVDRWSVSHELEQMTQRLQHVPLTIGDWVGKDQDDPASQALTQRLIHEGTLHALVSRVYRNRQTGQEVALLMATGRPGPISTHNPLTCYGASGFNQSSAVKPIAIKTDSSDGPVSGVFSRCSFSKIRDGIPEALTVFWAWHSPKGWTAAEDPRLAFAAYRALTKIYVVRSDQGYLAGLEPNEDQEPAVRFIQDSLPVIDDTLFGKSAAPESATASPAKSSPSASG